MHGHDLNIITILIGLHMGVWIYFSELSQEALNAGVATAIQGQTLLQKLLQASHDLRAVLCLTYRAITLQHMQLSKDSIH